ncbi:BamA/TamA family outer membrane protein [uncultured Cyclobacterium sp.]|uniref:translocation and assembly module lipoprotein TamL n=1 Tax=uncultured Cyclobacterium sp. TaxID=453820 RepID=UPI0030EFA0B3
MRKNRGTYLLGFLNIRAISALMLLVPFLGLVGCNVTKYIPENEKLYTGATLEINRDFSVKGFKELNAELEGLLKPEPNSKILGMRIGLWSHYKVQKENPGFINRFIYKKIGEEPVYFSSVEMAKTQSLILNRLDNNGFFFSEVDAEAEEQAKKASAIYTIDLAQPYQLGTYNYERDSLPIDRSIKKLLASTEIAEGDYFSLEMMKNERTRLDEGLKNEGFYNFNPDFLIFEADTNQYDKKKFDLFLRLKQNAPEKGIVPYEIKSIQVYPNYSSDEYGSGTDTTTIENIDFIQNGLSFKPDLLHQYILIEKDSLFNAKDTKLTSSRLTGIGNYRFVNLRYLETDTTIHDGKGALNANIYLTPLEKRSLRAEIQGVSKSNNFAGPALLLNYRNRNLFYGGETFSLTGQIGYESQIASGDRENLSAFEVGLKGDLIFPRVVFPIAIKERFAYSVPKTKISLGTEYQDRRGYYRLNTVSASYGYFWNANRFVYHEITPIALNFVDLSRTSTEFDEILDSNPFLKQSFEHQFIAGLTYSFAFNKLMDKYREHSIYFGANLDLAGGGIRLLNNVLSSENQNTFLGFNYAQYNKGDIDFRYYWRFTEEKLLAFRLFGGIGLPYGNSVSLPFAKQFFSGGPNSIRAFSIRSLGPGSYSPATESTSNYFDQAGDIRLEGNLEFRFPIVPYLKGAAFVDTGNVWLVNENEALPGGKFEQDWYRELAVGAGIGLRVDIEFFVIRFDLATPLRSPFLPEGERWAKEFKLGDSEWRGDNLVFNFAIGYPF